MEVIKFGGSSLVDASAMAQVAEVLEARKEVPKFVVLSAMGGHRRLASCRAFGARWNPAWHTLCPTCAATPHGGLCLLEGMRGRRGHRNRRRSVHVRSICEGLQLLHEFSDHTKDALVSMGERLSVPLMHAMLKQRGFKAAGFLPSTWS